MEKSKISGGYIIIARNIVESEIWNKPALYIKVWLYLLTRTQHSDYKKLKRGQLITSIPEIIEACSWYIGYRKEKPSKDQIYKIIEWLRKPCESITESNMKPTMITTVKATHKLLINIENFDFYQTPKNYESNKEDLNEVEKKAIGEQRNPVNINKNVKNELINNDDYCLIQNNENRAFHFYEQNGFGTLNPYVANKIINWINDFNNEELVIYAMKLAIEYNARSWKYIESILRNWYKNGLKTISDVQAEKLNYKDGLKNKEESKNGRYEPGYQEISSPIPQFITRSSSLE